MQEAVNWALQQTFEDDIGEVRLVTKDTRQQLVDYVRKYLNDNNIEYESFGYNDLIPYFN